MNPRERDTNSKECKIFRFPGGGLEYNSAEADLATKDFFSKFCFYIKAVNQDPSKLDQALQRLNNFLERTHIANGVSNGDADLQVRKYIFFHEFDFLEIMK